MIYSNKIIKTNEGIYLIKNYKKHRKLFSVFSLVASVMFLCLIILFITQMERYPPISLFFPVCMFVFLIYIANDIKKIVFDNNEKKIFFKYGLFIKMTKTINIDDLKEISINNTRIGVKSKRSMWRIEYNIDLIDKNLNAYRVYQSIFYNDDLILLAKSINEIINIELIDRKDVEGYMKIFKKRII